MYCRNCSFLMEPQDTVCKRCLTQSGLGDSFCAGCGLRVPKSAAFCSKCGSRLFRENASSHGEGRLPENLRTSGSPTQNAPFFHMYGKSRLSAALLGIFPTGVLGIHNFYLGYPGRGLAQLLMTVLSFGILMPAVYVWSILEGVFLLSGDSNCDGDGIPLRD